MKTLKVSKTFRVYTVIMNVYKSILTNSENYFAHIPSNEGLQKAETLSEHSDLVLQYAKSICDKFGLQGVIQKLINSALLYFSQELKELTQKLFFQSIYLHDFGKINPNFQNRKMGNNSFKQKQFEFGSDHSYPGAIMFINEFLSPIIENKNIKQAEKPTAVMLLLLFAFQISKHHSSRLPNAFQFVIDRLDFFQETEKIYLEQILGILKDQENLDMSDYWKLISGGYKNTGNTWIKQLVKKINDSISDLDISPFPLFALLKLHYSLLTASDYLATTHYMNNWPKPLNDFGTIDGELRKRILKNVRTTQKYNRKVFEGIEGYQFKYPTEPSAENLNRLRQELSVEVIQNIRKNRDKKVFYIEAPTGGGKTNLSMLAAAELLEQNVEISNLYYVFPFTTLITQTYGALKETLGLEEDEIIQIHSKEGFKEKEEGEYGQEKKNHIDYLFLNYPVALMSHVKFFDILKTNSKESNYLMHRLANSIVIIDELQSYPPKIWDKLIYFIQSYAEYFNIRFILMSATLPKLHRLSSAAHDICYLTNNKDKFFKNPNFSNRVSFDFSLLEWEVPEKDDKEEYLFKLGSFVVKKSMEYAEDNEKYPGSVFTIIEFIYKQTATEFSSIIREVADGFFDEIFVLSGTILEPRRKEIIHYLKNESNRDKKVILITTQVVEAGVDIDMDLGFKDKSLVDSDEQLAGRINRNINKPACKLFLFNCDNADVIYGNDKRYRLLKKELDGLDKEILKSKDFDAMYDRVMEEIDKSNERDFQEGFSDFLQYMKMLNFPEVDRDFQIINQSSTSVYVPLSVDLFVPGTNRKVRNFTEKEVAFLNDYQVEVSPDEKISGEDVFNLYKKIIEQKEIDFIGVKTELKKLQGIMSKFIFSLMTHSKSMEKLVIGAYGEERMGIYYLSHWEEDGIYNMNWGLIEKGEGAIIL